MPNLQNANTSFSSRQELLDLHDGLTPGSLDGHDTAEIQDVSPECFSPDSLSAVNQKIDTVSVEEGFREETGGSYGVKFVPADSEHLCGWGALTPQCIQAFNTPRWVLFFLCVASFLQGMIINGFINTVITSIERRFDLRSYQTGLIASSYDIAACICLTFVSYFGGTGHKPKWLGWGVLVMALGSLVFALPHFTTPTYQVSMAEQTSLCLNNRTSPCHESSSSLSSYRFVFMLGQFLHGVGATPLYTLGVTYLDENVKSSYAPVYIGIFYTAAIVGPAAGYLLGGIFLNMYTEIHQTTELTPENPLWVGAWWIGFILGGIAALVIALPILGYPRQLPGSQRYVAMRVSEAHQMKDGSQERAADPQFGKTVKDMPRDLLTGSDAELCSTFQYLVTGKRTTVLHTKVGVIGAAAAHLSVMLLLKNPTFIFLCFAGATEATLIAGMSTFGPKFLESQFSLSASEAATWFGYMVVPAGGGGTFLGGYFVKKLGLRCRGIIRFCMLCAVVSLLAIFIFLMHCPNVPMAGVTTAYHTSPLQHQNQHYTLFQDSKNRSQLTVNLTVGCNSGCHCTKQLYNPVCGSDGIMYYSPCHAGCTGVNNSQSTTDRQLFSSCSCIMGNTTMEEGFALAGKCSSSCQHMSVLLVFLFIVIFFTFLCSIPALTATLRCVPDSQRSFGLGIQWIVVRTLGGIPGPIAFGSMIDISCILWQDQCGGQGSCYLYQNSAMSSYTLAAGVIYKVLGTAFFLLACILYHPPPESPQSSCESTDHGLGDPADLPVKEVPKEMISNVNSKL